ncbi:TetR family transcriptional regulator [Ralstonia sp. 25C]|uniref:TetR family transcriptional regulator n=1 Tax=Ralstonia sp. 25C TaxID=3447363 RepID=UPI003F756942
MVRRTVAGAAQTRQRVINAAITVFSQHGVHAATLEDVAVRAGVTRGAVYGHFGGKPALVAAVLGGLRWPLDIGDDLWGYAVHPRPLQHLHAQLHAQLMQCAQDNTQWSLVGLVLRQSDCAQWPQPVIDHIANLKARAIANLGYVMHTARKRNQLRADMTPEAAARCLHAVGIGLLWEHAGAFADGVRIDIHPCLRAFFDGIENINQTAPSEAT